MNNALEAISRLPYFPQACHRDVDFESAHTSSLPTKLMQSLEVRI